MLKPKLRDLKNSFEYIFLWLSIREEKSHLQLMMTTVLKYYLHFRSRMTDEVSDKTKKGELAECVTDFKNATIEECLLHFRKYNSLSLSISDHKNNESV